MRNRLHLPRHPPDKGPGISGISHAGGAGRGYLERGRGGQVIPGISASFCLPLYLLLLGGNRIPGISRGWAGMSWDFSPGVFRLFYLTSHIPGSVPPLILLLYDLQWLQASAADKRRCNT